MPTKRRAAIEGSNSSIARLAELSDFLLAAMRQVRWAYGSAGLGVGYVVQEQRLLARFP